MSSKPRIVDDQLWSLVEPLLPKWPERSPGPRPVDDRRCLRGVLFVLYTGITWQQLPMELGFGSGQTCWRRLGRWREAGVFEALHQRLLAELNAAGQIDWSLRLRGRLPREGEKGGDATGPSPVDRGRTGSKHHVICDGKGTPFTVITTAANVNDVTQALALVDGIPPVAGRPGRPRSRPDTLLGHKAYDSNPLRRELRNRRIQPVISRKGSTNIQGLGTLRYVVEQTFALLHQFKRLAVRWERRPDLHEALASLACALICWRRLRHR
ncbi:IS5 family transposase [Streptomyces griseorubiginosus]|uniref:IS5 family transposase n=1 Tax=Streptomyces griseorubiginosus TaxID=67304 RepID=UPI002E801D5A|nr:IS5 family transposase [Streptomyces griseorubiginosus]WUB50256.1 IS5 family transposase [Streptomyces griseorubiginosus]